MLTSLRRIIVLGWQNLARDGGMAAANVFVIMIPVMLVAALLSLKAAGEFIINDLREKVDVSVYFNESAVEDDILRVKDKIKEISGIGQVDYVSKDQALVFFRERHQGNETILESLNEVNGNPLPSSLKVSAASPAQFEQLAALLEQGEYKDLVDEMNYVEKKDVINEIFSFMDQARKVGLWLFAILALVSVMVTFNTVRMAIFARKREIGVQRLVGASRWFIRGQFLVEGIIFGFLAAVLSFLAAAAICRFAGPALAPALSGMDLWQNYSANLWQMLWAQMAVGVGLGAFSSLIAVSRHLKV